MWTAILFIYFFLQKQFLRLSNSSSGLFRELNNKIINANENVIMKTFFFFFLSS